MDSEVNTQVLQKLKRKVKCYVNKLKVDGDYKKLFNTYKILPNLARKDENDNFTRLFSFLHDKLAPDEYLKNVSIQKKVPYHLEKQLLNSQTLTKIVNMDVYHKTINDETWKRCKSDCFRFWKMLVEKEVHSTAYMLRLITRSILKTGDGGFIKFENSSKLTGVWEQDYQKIKLLMTNETEKNKKKRTILGFGPSSSGKTYWAEQIIELFVNQDPDFPKIFLSVDGGIMRESSVVYQTILKQNEIKDIPGFLNLVSAGFSILNPSIFASDKIKKQLVKFLEYQSQQGNRISLYVPETLGGCFFNCQDKYNKYINLTEDRQGWIGLMIYQHLRDCPFDEGYQCVGTENAGTNRQIHQGKKYSASAYSNSFKNGRNHLKKSPFCRLEIHNSGGKKGSKTTITEYPNAEGRYQIPETKNQSYQVIRA